MNTIHTQKSPEQIQATLAAAVVAFGQHTDASYIFYGLQIRLGFACLSCFYQAYLIKAKGGTDDQGITWPPLKPETIAYKRLHPGLNSKRKEAEAAGRPGRPLLTDAQDAIWRKVYSQKLYEFEQANEADASGHAAAIAWIVVKNAGGKTIIGEYGDTKVEIGRDTGRAINAMALAVRSQQSSDDVQVRTEPSAVLVAMRVSYMVHFHKKRPLWNSKWPRSYAENCNDVAKSFFAEALPKLLT